MSYPEITAQTRQSYTRIATDILEGYGVFIARDLPENVGPDEFGSYVAWWIEEQGMAEEAELIIPVMFELWSMNKRRYI